MNETNSGTIIDVLDSENPSERDGGECTANDRPDTVANREEEKEQGLLPVIIV